VTRPPPARVSAAPARDRQARKGGGAKRAVHGIRAVLASPGRPLEPATRTVMESRFGQDFSRVRLHTDDVPDAVTSLGAPAFTVGRHVMFGSGHYRPETPSGAILLAHELAHVVQQREVSETVPDEIEIGSATDAREVEAVGSLGQALSDGLGARPTIRLAPLAVPHLQGGFLGWTGTFLLDLITRPWKAVPRLFGSQSYSDDELHAYLRHLRNRGVIEGDYDSDNKAREITRRWVGGNPAFVLTAPVIAVMIHELLEGHTGRADELAILELLERSDNAALATIFGVGGITATSLMSDFSGREEAMLRDFFGRRFAGGYAAVSQRRIQPRGTAVPIGVAITDRAVGAPARDEGPAVERDIRRPEAFPTFESWIQQFQQFLTPQASFAAIEGEEWDPNRHLVIGQQAPPATATDPTAPPKSRRPFVLHAGSRAYLPHDRFIDGPTDLWVRRHLPPNLVATAYQLPCDCADLAVILRHVWLVAHRRTEEFGGWVLGAALDDPRTEEIRDLIRGGRTHSGAIVSSATLERLVRPYTGPDGRPIRDLPTLRRLLHVGDLLVWDHPAPRGGHAHTVLGIERHGQQLTMLRVLQGNEPIGDAEARRIMIEEFDYDPDRLPPGRQEAWSAQARSLERELRTAPGRRIEANILTGDNLRQDVGGVWTIWGGSQLVAAGPPTGQFQPATRTGRTGTDVVRGLSDWEPEVRGAQDVWILQTVVEAALLEARSLFEGGHTSLTTQPDAVRFGRAVGTRLWSLATASARPATGAAGGRGAPASAGPALAAGDLGEESHYRPLRHLDGLMRQLGREARVADVRRLFDAAADELRLAARGITSVGFDRSAEQRRGVGADADARVSRFLLTGFDPFEFAGGRQIEPLPGRFNPSGAAVLQLDGSTVPVAQRHVAAVEGVVLPVHFGEFRAGIVESQLGPRLRDADAVITVSESPKTPPSGPVRVERYAVGVHRLNNNRLEAIPGPPGRDMPAPAIIEAGPNIDLAATAAEAGTALPQGQAPTLGDEVTLRFPSLAEADRALRALGLPRQGRAEVSISRAQAIRQITQTMVAGVQGPGFTFRAGAETFQAVVVQGPGGAFLSNEVSFRVLRYLAVHNAAATSFHVHVPSGGGGHIRQDVTGVEEAQAAAAAAGRQAPTPEERAAARDRARQERLRQLETGRSVVRRVVSALIELVKAVARRI
jgi:pyrrolidone-carboxylate peptidase